MKNYWRLLNLFAPAWLPMLAAWLFALLAVIGNVGLLAAAAYLISAAALYPPLGSLSPAIAGVRFFGLLRAIARYLERFASHDATFRLLSRIRVAVYSALEPLVPVAAGGFRGGELFNRIMNDIETLQHFYLKVLLPPLVAVFVLTGMMIVIAHFAVDLAVLLLAGFVCSGLILPYCLHRVGRATGCKWLQSRENLTILSADSLSGLRDLLAFNEAGRQLQRVNLAVAEQSQLQARAVAQQAWAKAAGSLLNQCTVAAAIVLTVPLLEAGRFDGVYFAAVVLAIQSSFEAVQPLTVLAFYWNESQSALHRLFAVLDAKPNGIAVGTDRELPADCTLVVENLTFRYGPEREPALQQLSFDLPVGKRVALVGPSGAGKSSLVSLLARFWEYETGSLRLGGREVRCYHPDTVRETIGIVMQDDYLFHASLAENIRLSRPSAGDEEIWAAIEQAGLGAVVRNLPLGLETVVGEKGYGLSGGERRKVLIARAMLKNAPILVLDEPTAGLDPLAERELMKWIETMTRNKTLLLITHRLTALERMDEILVMEKGRIVERGTYEKLLRQNGLFYQMWQLQHDVFSDGTGSADSPS
ncbi:MAG: transporter, CydDC cysteine exporter (CydDC-E) family, permease/ATP-binding protein CydC [Firmicutes bacterium]|nr:transporter, CydDC cysteine exporter (CydDC-E) family, permease/ATP-binding protein CydC [Bacillota bacterium]